MKCVIIGDEILGIEPPFKKELETGSYYEIPDELVHRYEDAVLTLRQLEEELKDYANRHPMEGELADLEPAPTVPILPPGVDK